MIQNYAFKAHRPFSLRYDFQLFSVQSAGNGNDARRKRIITLHFKHNPPHRWRNSKRLSTLPIERGAVLDYYRNAIGYTIGEPEKEGLRKFLALAYQYGYCGTKPEVQFVV